MEQRDRDPSDSEEERQLQEGIRLSMMGQESSPDASPSSASQSKSKREANDEMDRRTTKRARISTKSTSQPLSRTSSNITMAFPNGALRITRTPGRQNQKNCINLGDLIHKEHLVSACIYAFFIARDELFRHLPLSQSSDDVPVSSSFQHRMSCVLARSRVVSFTRRLPLLGLEKIPSAG